MNKGPPSWLSFTGDICMIVAGLNLVVMGRYITDRPIGLIITLIAFLNACQSWRRLK